MEFFKAAGEMRESTSRREATFLNIGGDQGGRQNAGHGDRRLSHPRRDGGRAEDGSTDMIGVARPFCLDPDFPRRMLSGDLDVLSSPEGRLALGRGEWGPMSRSDVLRGLNGLAKRDGTVARSNASPPAEPPSRTFHRGGRCWRTSATIFGGRWRGD